MEIFNMQEASFVDVHFSYAEPHRKANVLCITSQYERIVAV